MGCSRQAPRDTVNNNASVAVTTTPPLLLTAADFAKMRRVPADTISTQIDPVDAYVTGPATRLVVRGRVAGPGDLAKAWAFVVGRGTPPVLDFSKDAALFIATVEHGTGNWHVVADSVFATGTMLYVVVHEYSDCTATDIMSRGITVLRVPVAGWSQVTFVERPFEERCIR